MSDPDPSSLINPADLLNPTYREAPLVKLIQSDFTKLTPDERIAETKKLREVRGSAQTKKKSVERKKKKPIVDISDYL